MSEATFAHNIGRSGDAAGQGENGVGMWTQFNFISHNDTSEINNSHGQIYVGAVGMDYMVDETLLIGAAVTLDGVNLDTSYNSGTLSSFGYGIAPYASLQVTDEATVNATAGYGRASGDVTRRDHKGGAGNFAGEQVTGDFDATRFFAALNAEVAYDIDGLWLIGMAGLSYAQEKIKGYTQSNGDEVASNKARVGTMNIGGQAGYDVEISRGMILQPYARYSYNYDYTRSGDSEVLFADIDKIGDGGQFQPSARAVSNDRSSHTVGGGLNFFFLDPSISAGLGFDAELGRKDQKNYSGSASLRVQF